MLDRSGIILEIFNRHARTKEAKLQVEMARLQYLMPRLTHLWSHFERQRGSGGGALKGKGMGEKQIEVDRRLVKARMDVLRRRMREVEGSRQLHRKQRESLLKVAIVGYTNAGKSTLLNALTHSDVLVEDALFATLDATVRLLNPKSRPAVLGIDTVGFIDRLPHGLVASFRSTLGEVLEADLLVHVLDASHAEVKRHFDVTMQVLAELGAVKLPDETKVGVPVLPNADPASRPKRKMHETVEKPGIPMLIVFNKMDKCPDPAIVKVWGASLMREYATETPLYVSALNKGDVNDMRGRIMRFFEQSMQVYEVVVVRLKTARPWRRFTSWETSKPSAPPTRARSFACARCPSSPGRSTWLVTRFDGALAQRHQLVRPGRLALQIPHLAPALGQDVGREEGRPF